MRRRRRGGRKRQGRRRRGGGGWHSWGGPFGLGGESNVGVAQPCANGTTRNPSLRIRQEWPLHANSVRGVAEMDRLQSMRVFQHVAAEGGFAAAARKMDMDPAAITRLVADLEEHLGARLLNRTTRR